MRCYLLGLGSNISPEIHIPAAAEELKTLGEITHRSPVIATQAVGETFHSDFHNQLIILCSNYDKESLKEQLLAIELKHGREEKSPARKTKDRTIDIDILLSADSADECMNTVLEESYYRQVQRQWHQAENV